MYSIFVGFDAREADAFAVCRHSIRRHLTGPIPIFGIVTEVLRAKGLYWREHELRDDGRWYDVISDAPISTEHACARFLTPHLAERGWALFCDGDILFRKNVARIFDALDPKKAVYCVKHRHEPEPGVKMDGQIQTRYARKNWSSVMIFNCDHPSNRKLTVEMVNSIPGRDLHRFVWLEDDEIGSLDPAWNWLTDHSDPSIDPYAVHYSIGTPSMAGYENGPFASEWRAELSAWAQR